MSSNNDDVIYEALETNKGHDSQIISNTIYSGLSRKEAKREKSNHEKFMQWTQSLGGNRDVVSETHSFQYAQKTTEYDSKGKPIKRQLPQQQQEEQYSEPANVQVSSYSDSVEERFFRAKREAGLI